MSMTNKIIYYKIKYSLFIECEFMLQEYRKRAKITQEKLSEITGLDRKTIFRIENDKTIPKVDNYAKMVVALNLSNEEIGEHIRKIAKNKDK